MPCEDSLQRGARYCCEPSNVVIHGSHRGTESSEGRERRTIRVVPIGEPAFLCSTRNGVTCHLLLPVRSTATGRARPYRAASANSSSFVSDRPGTCSDTVSVSLASSAFVSNPRRYASTTM